jgi:hypothetical protein
VHPSPPAPFAARPSPLSWPVVAAWAPSLVVVLQEGGTIFIPVGFLTVPGTFCLYLLSLIFAFIGLTVAGWVFRRVWKFLWWVILVTVTFVLATLGRRLWTGGGFGSCWSVGSWVGRSHWIFDSDVFSRFPLEIPQSSVKIKTRSLMGLLVFVVIRMVVGLLPNLNSYK